MATLAHLVLEKLSGIRQFNWTPTFLIRLASFAQAALTSVDERPNSVAEELQLKS